MPNPLLEQKPTSLPDFNSIQPEHIEPAIDACIANCKHTIEKVSKSEAHHSFASLISPLEDADDTLNRAFSPVSHLNAVMNSPALREAYEACLTKISAYGTEALQNHALYLAYQALSEKKPTRQLSHDQRKVIKDALLNFKLAGVSLNKSDQLRFKNIQTRLSELSNHFSNNVLDCTDAWEHCVQDVQKLSGIPEHVLTNARQPDGHFKFDLQFPTYHTIMTYADDPELREVFYRAYATRGASTGPHDTKFDNSTIMNEILALRHEKAQLLSYANYAEYSLAKKTAPSTDQVESFLEGLSECALPAAKKELKELEAYAGRKLNAWDISYYIEKLRNERFHFSEEELRDYFPIHSVLNGLFKLCQILFGIEIYQKENVSVWHSSVSYYEVFDQNKKLRGGFYLDLFARKNKRSGAWMDECRVRRKISQTVQNPVAFLTCNFTEDIDGTGSRLTHDEVETLFHEFGHTLHHILSQIDYPEISGINGVPWDAVELPSQFLENFCWQKEVIDMISCHYKTQETLPLPLFQKLKDSHSFMAGLAMVRQIEFSLFDFRLHRTFNPQKIQSIQSVLDQVRKQVSVILPPLYNRFENSFSHIFSGGYAAGYYSYLWAEVLSSDVFSRFQEEGILNPEVGSQFMQIILEKGGSQDPMRLFKKFRGRDPDINALLEHRGLK